jgi:hypothetical protein
MENSMDFKTHTCFKGHRRIASGSLPEIALAVKQARESGTDDPVVIFDNSTGRTIDIDTRGTDKEMQDRLSSLSIGSDESSGSEEDLPAATDKPQGRGRPKLGVTPREVTLLPRHWEWLATQPGGASVTLRKLVEEARRAGGEKEKMRKAQERTYCFMSAIAGDLPGYEEAIRALFANDREALNQYITAWPIDVREHTILLAFGHESPIAD